MNKFLTGSLLVVLSLILTGVANAASTIGTNMSTTGTFTQTVGSATAARFQNAAGTTTVLWVDTTNTKVGVNAGADLDTVFEVGGTASISGISTWADGQFRPQSNGATAFRFQNVAGTTSVLTIDTTNTRVGIGTTPVTTFEVQGTASASYFLTGNTIQVGGYASASYNRFGTVATTHALSATNDVLINGILEVDGKAFFDDTASVSGNFEVIGTASASKAFVTKSFVVGSNLASSSTAYVAEFVSAATTSVLFGGSSATLGTCLQLKNTTGGTVYARVVGTTWTVNALECR